MRYDSVCIEGLGHAIPDEVVTSAWLEEQLASWFRALDIPMGQFERLTGIRERRWWPEGMAFSDGAVLAAEQALERAGIDRGEIGCIVNASVCRDFLEPSTASIVHDKLGLPPSAMNFDVSNACLGFLNGMAVVAGMIEAGQIEAGLVVSCEGSRQGQLATIERLRAAEPRFAELYENFAGFTIGSGAVAMVLTHRRRTRADHRLRGGVAYAETVHRGLCFAESTVRMTTHSAALLRTGLAVIGHAWEGFEREFGWTPATVDRVFTHQVAEKQRALGLRQTGFPTEGKDYPTLHTLGNIASVSAPLGLSMAAAEGLLDAGDRLCLVGVGSGINSMVLGIEW